MSKTVTHRHTNSAHTKRDVHAGRSTVASVLVVTGDRESTRSRRQCRHGVREFGSDPNCPPCSTADTLAPRHCPLSLSLSLEQGFVRLSLCHEQLSVWRTARVCCCSLLIRSTALPIINISRATGQRFFDCCCQRRSRKRKIWRDPMTRMCGDPLWQSSCTSNPINTTTSSHFTLHTALSLCLSRSGFIFQLKSCLFRWRAHQARYRGFLILHTHTHTD